ncbi:hypothetical protein [Serratia sp. 14-2641]|uniref:hypothetical protein n=1 Tax=Serratia sp. 14-2641 TaxID=1841657 RepID=UPI00080F9AB5|nr:hypothetical protein [Serratia sp. 14-2641]OCJ27168.1 hypothetical protein A6U95_28700 [Serratia sp. 14-2641]
MSILRKVKYLSKYIDQFSFALLNVGTIFFISKFLASDQAAKYVLVSSYASFSLIVIVAIVISPYWIFSADTNKRYENFIFSFYATLGISILCGSVLGGLFTINSGSYTSGALILALSIAYPVYDFLRRSLYVHHGEFVSAICSALLCFFVAILYLILNYLDVSVFEVYVIVLISFIAIANLVMYKFNIHLIDSSIKKVKISYRAKSSDYWSLGKWSAGSMTCFWMATQGLFIILSKHISDEQLVTTRLCLSITGIIAIYFTALENNLMPSLRKQFINKQYDNILVVRKSYYIKGFLFSASMSLIIALFYNLFFQNGIFIFAILCCYQIFSGLLKFESYFLKVLQKHNVVFLSNFVALVATLIFGYLLGVENDYVLALMILFNGIVCSMFYLFFSKFLSSNGGKYV